MEQRSWNWEQAFMCMYVCVCMHTNLFKSPHPKLYTRQIHSYILGWDISIGSLFCFWGFAIDMCAHCRETERGKERNHIWGGAGGCQCHSPFSFILLGFWAYTCTRHDFSRLWVWHLNYNWPCGNPVPTMPPPGPTGVFCCCWFFFFLAL